jgi:salicylate hydroxylase
MKNLNIVIVGAGIGGLETALALACDGHKITVLEAVSEFAEVQISIHEPHILRIPYILSHKTLV